MRVERIYDWHRGEGITERDPQNFDPTVSTPNSIRIGHVGDTHLGKGTPGKRHGELRRWLETLTGLGVDLIVHSGDLIEDPGDDDAVDRALSLLDDVQVPLYGVPGNHDVSTPGQPSEITRYFGPFPRSVAVDPLRLWLLDSMAAPARDERSQKERDAARQSGFFSRGAIGSEQLDSLRAKMDAAEPVPGPEVAVVHHHLRQPVPAKPWYEENADLMAPLEDADELIEVLRRGGVSVVLHGHRHQYICPYAPFDDLLIVNAGTSTPDRPPRRSRLLDVAAGGDAIRLWELVRFT